MTELSSAARDTVDSKTPWHITFVAMTWRRSFSPEPISPQGEQSGFARVVLAAEVELAVAATPTSGQIVIVVGRDRRVIVDASVDAAALARVLQVLGRR